MTAAEELKLMRCISGNIRKLRLERKISIVEAAKSLGIGKTTYAKIDGGVAFPFPEEVLKIADFLGVTSLDIFAGSGLPVNLINERLRGHRSLSYPHAKDKKIKKEVVPRGYKNRRECLSCESFFNSMGPHNRVCQTCFNNFKYR